MAREGASGTEGGVRAAAREAVDGVQIGPVDAGRLLREAIKNAYKHDVPGLASEIAFNGALTLMPFLLLLASLPVVLEDVLTVTDLSARVAAEADVVFTEALAGMIKTILDEVSRSRGLAAFFFGSVGTIWSGMSMMSSIRKALNRIYGFEEHLPYLLRKLYQAGLAVSTAAIALLAFFALLVGPNLVQTATGPLTVPVTVLIAGMLMLSAVTVVYWLAPAGGNQFRWVTPGALLFAVAWLTFSLAFSVYLAEFSALNRFYGSLGVMIIILAWLYGSAYALLLGAEVNAGTGRRFDPKVSREGGPAEGTS